jgi:hypothetical protein
MLVFGVTLLRGWIRLSNWKDIRVLSTSDTCSWCYGAPGIAASRGMHEGFDITRDLPYSGHDAEVTAAIAHPVVARIIKTASNIAGRGLQPGEHNMSAADISLCCGVAGCCDMLVQLAQLHDDAALQAEAHAILMATLGHVFITRMLENDDRVGFFTSAVGLAYACMRVLYPTQVPCIPLFVPASRAKPAEAPLVG